MLNNTQQQRLVALISMIYYDIPSIEVGTLVQRSSRHRDHR